MKFFLKIVILTVITLLVSTAKGYQTMRSTDITASTETLIEDDGVFVEMSYAYTIRTIQHLLEEQKAEAAILPYLSVDEGKNITVSPPLFGNRRHAQQLDSISLLPSDHPFRLRYLTHGYYVYTLERILI